MKSGGKKNGKHTRVESLKHKDKRTNIPTEELRDFVAEDERKPKTVVLPGLLYARDPSLDPQLVWKGKDEQDRQALEVLAVPIYIQEKIHPQALIEDLRAEAKKNGKGESLSLFADFNGIRFEDLVDFYAHKDGVNWSNRMILGDSLLVMTSLAEKEGLKGKVQMIYMDPPYGIKFDSNWQVSTRRRDVTDGRPEDVSRDPEVVKAFRDTWRLGINSYLAYLRDRLVVARELLTESGSIFVQIGDENVHLVRSLLDEVLGSANAVALIRFRKKTMPLGATFLERMGDFLIWYSKDKEAAEQKYKKLYQKQDYSEDFHWDNYEMPDGSRHSITSEQKESGFVLPEGARRFRLVSLWPASYSANAVFPVKFRGGEWWPAPGQCWPTSPEKMQRLVKAEQLEPEGKYLRIVLYSEGAEHSKLTTDWLDTIGARDQHYVVETSPEVVARCVLMTTSPGDLVLDPTCGSGTTAFVAEQWGRRWITIDASRVALALARTRLMAARYPYYVLADSPEGIQKEAEITGQVPAAAQTTANEIKKGFVYRRFSHFTLKAIANNEEVDATYDRWQEKLEPIQEALNRALKKSWEEWEVPREVNEEWPEKAHKLHSEYWQLRRQRQKEMDASIARRADTEFLYDRPYEDPKRIRVTGPFTVESLSPHRVLSGEDEQPASEREPQMTAGPGQFETMILENLRKAGVQNTVKNERLKFERLEPYAGVWVHAAGDYIESGKTKRVAVSIGPEHGTVGPDLVKEAAKEAVQGVGFDLLLVCGFAFDPHVSEEAKRYGKLNVLTTRMNPDLSMGDELLKKTGAGNLFMIFGEPDIDIKKTKDGKLTAQIKGVDVYDPTTGQIRSHSTDDIACWFIDTNYNGESFFVRHAYFTGADEPYEKLKRALRAEIDEAAWSALYSTKSRPFDPPKTGKIAVKVINHYGDEVLKIYQV
jgi:adenine-specific DNA-methyltransferase